MLKNEMNSIIAENAKVNVSEANRVVEALVEVINSELAAGNKVTIGGLGIFEIREKAERQGINPRSGEKITIAACKSVGFKAAKSLKEKVNA